MKIPNRLRKAFDLSGAFRGQGLLEFALVLPILLLLMLGIIEFGRLFFMYSSVSNAAREAARYGITVGTSGSSLPHYLDCDGIAATAAEMATLAEINVTIGYDNGGTIYRGDCPTVSALAQSGNNPVETGDRIVITTTTTFVPIVPLVQIPPISFEASTARTILRGVSFDTSLPQPPQGCYSLALDSSPLVGGSVTAVGGNRCAQDGRFYEEGAVVTLVAQPNAIYYFQKWEDDAVPAVGICTLPEDAVDCPNATVTMTENRSAVAVFGSTLDCLFVETAVDPPNSGSIRFNSPYNCQVNFRDGWAEGSVVQFQAVPATGYGFTSWEDDAIGTANPTNVVFVDGDKTVTANFVADVCNSLYVNLNPQAGGSYTLAPPQNCPGGWITGTVVSLAATANPTYDFWRWTGDIDSTDPITTPTTSIALDSNKVVNLEFSTDENCFNLTVRPDPAVGGTASALPRQNCAGGWTEGTFVYLYANANPGYSFDRWDGDEISAVSPAVIEMDASKVITAYYEFTGNDIAIVKSATRAVDVGDIITYTLRVINNGTVPATTVLVRDPLPSGVEYAGYRSTLGNCAYANGTVICNVGTLPAGPSSTEMNIFVEATQIGTVVNRATVTAGEIDPFITNNADTADTVVKELTDLMIEKSAPSAIVQGNTLTYTLTATNNGPGVAYGVTVSDTLPSTVQYISSSHSSCVSNGGREVLCALGDMDMGDVISFTIEVIPIEISVDTGEKVLQPIQDTYIDSFDGKGNVPSRVNNNFNGLPIQVKKATGEDTYGLIQFDLSSYRDPIESAFLELDVDIDGSSEEISVFQINGPWTESVVTFRNFASNYNANRPYGSASTAANGKLTIDITTLAQGWASGALVNHGLLLRGTDAGNALWKFDDSSEGRTPPKLIIQPPSLVTFITNRAYIYADDVDGDLANNSDEAKTNVSAGGSFITVSPICGEKGGDVVVTGRNWLPSASGLTMDIIFEPSELGTDTTSLFSQTVTPVNGTWSESVTIPAGAIDDFHRLRVRHGLVNVTARVQVPCPAPNLVSAQPTLIGTQPYTVSAPIQFNVVVTNIGNLAALSQFPVGLYVNPSPPPVTNSTHISQSFRSAISMIGGLGAGQSRVLTFTLGTGLPYSGTHSIYSVADSDPAPIGEITERYEIDNIGGPLAVLAQGAPPPPTPTPPPPAITATIYGRAYIFSGGVRLPQDNVEINLYDEAAGTSTYAGTAYTNSEGAYRFDNASAPSSYTVSGCVNIDGNDYYYSVSGVPVPADSEIQVDLILTRGVCGP